MQVLHQATQLTGDDEALLQREGTELSLSL
eukprot:COSAG03_NODE_29155_length_189_cov_20.344444_1_plen_29_part_10